MVISGFSTAASVAASLCAVAGSVTVGVAAVYRWLSRLEKVVAVVEKRSQELTPGPAEDEQGEHAVSLRDDVSNILGQLVSNRKGMTTLADKINAVAAQLVQHMNAPLVHRCSECGPPGSVCGGSCQQLVPPDGQDGAQPPPAGPAGGAGPAAPAAPPAPRPPGSRWGWGPRA